MAGDYYELPPCRCGWKVHEPGCPWAPPPTKAPAQGDVAFQHLADAVDSITAKVNRGEAITSLDAGKAHVALRAYQTWRTAGPGREASARETAEVVYWAWRAFNNAKAKARANPDDPGLLSMAKARAYAFRQAMKELRDLVEE